MVMPIDPGPFAELRYASRYTVYLPEVLYERLREVAFQEQCKIHDIVLEGIRLALGKRGRKR
jgi:hypothetical protein